MTPIEAQATFNEGRLLYVLHGPKTVTVTKLEVIASGLLRISLSNGNCGLHSAGNLATAPRPKRQRPGMAGLVAALRP
jgi:hypothetical protein